MGLGRRREAAPGLGGGAREVLDRTARPIQSQFVAHAIRKVLPKNGVLVVDAGNGGKHVRVFIELRAGHVHVHRRLGLGGRGPSDRAGREARAAGAAGAGAVGDMGMMCNIGELETAVRENIPVVYVVFNDQGLGNERAFQNEHYGGRFFAVDYNNLDFGALARVFGAHGEHVEEPGDLRRR